MYLNAFGASSRKRRGRCKGSLTRLRNTYNKDYHTLKDDHREQLCNLKQEHQNELNRIKSENKSMMNQLIEKYTSEHQKEISALQTHYQQHINQLNSTQRVLQSAWLSGKIIDGACPSQAHRQTCADVRPCVRVRAG